MSTLRKEKGSSLIELIASLAVLAMMSSMIVSGITTGRRVWERNDSDTAAIESVASAQMVLRNRLEAAFPQTRFDASAPYSDFSGTQTGVTFLAPPGDAGKPAVLDRYSLGLDGGGNLSLSSRSDLATNSAATKSAILLHGVQSVDVSYYGDAPPDNIQQWRTSWAERPGLPLLVRVRVQFASGDRRWWPELIVRPKATVDSACVLDQQAGACRGRT